MLRPLQAVIGVVERRQTMPILSNVLLVADKKGLAVTGTDLEVELVAHGEIEKLEAGGEITVPGRKLLDICKALPEGAEIKVKLEGDRLKLSSGRTQFVLSTLPAADFPVVEDSDATHSLRLEEEQLQVLLEKTHFAMAQQDVRYYLNGLMIETGAKRIRAVATDGHRLALCERPLEGKDVPPQQVIVPRKGVLELQRLLGGGEAVEIALGTNHVRATIGDIRFTSKLIDGRFPDYERVIPKPKGNILKADRETLRAALQRAAILSNEKYRGIRMDVRDGELQIEANNPDQEQARDELQVDYQGQPMEIGFNVNYLLDALTHVGGEQVQLGFVDPNSSCLIESEASPGVKYVVMPMRL